MNQTKHAFLIIAHNQWEHLKKLVTLLDHPRVDIYLHIDKKSKFPTPDPISPLVKKGKLFFVPRLSVNWGGRSQIRCEFSLIRAATPGEYAYYHLISGVDLPLKPIDEILSFFDENQGKEFIHVDSPTLKPELYARFSLYYPFQERARRYPFLSKIQWVLVALQRRLGVNRVRNPKEPFAKGANWFSCTHPFLKGLLLEEKKMMKQFRFSHCCDEIFLQSYLVRSPFVENLYDPSFSDHPRSYMRHIDWTRGEPYTFRDEDLEELLASPYLFARKFDYEKYPAVVDGIVKALSR